MSSSLDALRALVERHFGNASARALPHVAMQIGACPATLRVTYAPTLFFMLQGTKRLFADGRVLEARDGGHVYGSVDLPAIGEATPGCARTPFMGVALTVDPVVVAELLLGVPAHVRDPAAHVGIELHPLGPDLLEPLLRLVSLLDTPEHIPVLAPLVERELLYRALLGPHGGWLRAVSRSGARIAQVRRAIEAIRSRPNEPVRIEALADRAGMSASSLHRHFKALTSMSPLQYQKHVRLQEARRRLVADPGEVATVAYAVGYQSVSQFTREYARQFGLPPVRDARRVRSDFARASPL